MIVFGRIKEIRQHDPFHISILVVIGCIQEVASPGEGLGLKYIEDLASGYIKKQGKNSSIDKIKLINDHLDIRLFGILFAVGNIHFKQIGPVQFSIGQSLNEPVEEITVRMTRIVPNTRKEDEEGESRRSESGTFGEKAMVRYSFLPFHGFVNNNVSEEVNLTEKDIMDVNCYVEGNRFVEY